MFKKIEILLVAMAVFAAGENLAGGDVERGKKRGRAVAEIVMGHAFDIAQPHRQDGLGAVQRLNLTLLIHTQNHGVLGRIQVQTDNIADFFNEKGICGDFEMALPMGLQAKGAPDPLDGGPGDLGFLGDRACRPVGPVGRLGLDSLSDKLGDSFIGDRAGATRTEFVVKAGESLFPISLSPQDHRWGTIAEFGSDRFIGGAFGRHQNDLRSGDQAIGQGS